MSTKKKAKYAVTGVSAQVDNKEAFLFVMNEKTAKAVATIADSIDNSGLFGYGVNSPIGSLSSAMYDADAYAESLKDWDGKINVDANPLLAAFDEVVGSEEFKALFDAKLKEVKKQIREARKAARGA